jgi:hypothetical protein
MTEGRKQINTFSDFGFKEWHGRPAREITRKMRVLHVKSKI